MANVSSPPPVAPPSVTFATPASTATMNAPPAKRPRLSPGATASASFFASPTTSSYSLPLAEASHPSYNSFNEPLPAVNAQTARAGANAMKPPEKPSDKQAKGQQAKVTDLVELSDIFKDSGVDLREEENYLYDSYKEPVLAHPGNAVSAIAPFSQGSTSVSSPSQTFDTWRSSQNATQLTQASGVSAPFSQPPINEDEMKDLVREKHLAAATEQAKMQELHLKDPFILANPLRERMELRTSEFAVRHKPEGIITQPLAILNADKNDKGEGIVAAKTLLAADSSLVPLLTLISLATRERVRSVLEDSYGTSRARVFGSGGIVPPEWTDIAKGEGKAEETTAKPQSLSGTAWDAIPDSAISPLTVIPSKRLRNDDESKRRTSPPPPPEPQPQRTIRFSSRTPSLLLNLGTKEVELERERLATRKKRAADKEAREATGASAAGTDGTSAGAATSTPMTSSTPAPSAAPAPPKLTKKERERQAKPVQTEEALRRQSNLTASMQLGGFSRKYQWLTAASGGAGGAASSGKDGNTANPLTPGAVLREKLAASAEGRRKDEPAKGDSSPLPADRFRTVGRFMEKPGIQLRDVVSVLELEGGKEKKTLLKGYTRLGKEK